MGVGHSWLRTKAIKARHQLGHGGLCMSACVALTQEGAEREALRGCLVHPHVPVGTWTDTVQPRVVRNRMEVGGGATQKRAAPVKWEVFPHYWHLCLICSELWSKNKRHIGQVISSLRWLWVKTVFKYGAVFKQPHIFHLFLESKSSALSSSFFL